MSKIITHSSLKRGFYSLKDKCLTFKKHKTNKLFDDITKTLSDVKLKQENIDFKIEKVDKWMVFRDEFLKLERSLEKRKIVEYSSRYATLCWSSDRNFKF